MRAPAHRVRIEFLIVLTIAVAAFGATNLLRSYRTVQQRRGAVATEHVLRAYVNNAIEQELAEIESFAQAGRGPLSRDAAALLAQAQCLAASGAPVVRTGPSRSADQLQTIRANFQRLKAGQPAVFPLGTPMLRAHYRALDGAFRPYGICLPATYTHAAAWPVIVSVVTAEKDDWACRHAPSYDAAISVQLALPARACCDWLAEQDVLNALDEVRTLYSVAPDRVYLVGRGAAMRHCWSLAERHPDLFAGVAALGSPGGPGGPRAEGAGLLAELRRFVEDTTGPGALAANLLPIRVVSAETAVPGAPPACARAPVAALVAGGGQVDCLEFPRAAGAPLPSWVEDYAVAKVFAARSELRPASFRFAADHPRNGRAWWIEVEALMDPVRPATVEAEESDETAAVRTTNVAALSLLVASMPERPRWVSVDGERFAAPTDAGALAFERRRDDGWRPAEEHGLAKRPGTSGPLADVFHDPFLVVYGTNGPQDLRETVHAQALRFAERWQALHGAAPRVKADADVTPADVRLLNLVLLGGPQANSVTANLAAELPLTLQEGRVVVDGHAFTGSNLGVLLCYPNPLNRRRMVALVAGTTPAAQYGALDRFGLWPEDLGSGPAARLDYGVFDALSVGPDTLLAAGFFDNRWRAAASGEGSVGGGALWLREPASVEGIQPQGYPALASAGDPAAAGPTVALSDVRPLQVEQAGAVGFGRTCAGGPIRLGGQAFERGFGVAAPSELAFELSGRFARFNAAVGLADGAESADTAVLFEVRGDGRVLATAEVRPGQSPTEISAPVSGVRVLSLACRPRGQKAPLPISCAWAEPTLSR